MSDRQDMESPKNESAPAADDGAAPRNESAGEGGAPAATSIEARELEALRAKAKERDELYDRLLRQVAEFDNYQKRTRREMERFREDAARDLLKDLLVVVDNLELALQSATPAPGASADDTLAAVSKGVAMVRDQLLRLLAQRAVEPLGTKPGDPFDPDRHEAVMVAEAPGIARDEVGMVAREGYRLGQTVLRPASVQVRKAAPGQAGT